MQNDKYSIFSVKFLFERKSAFDLKADVKESLEGGLEPC